MYILVYMLMCVYVCMWMCVCKLMSNCIPIDISVGKFGKSIILMLSLAKTILHNSLISLSAQILFFLYWFLLPFFFAQLSFSFCLIGTCQSAARKTSNSLSLTHAYMASFVSTHFRWAQLRAPLQALLAFSGCALERNKPNNKELKFMTLS